MHIGAIFVCWWVGENFRTWGTYSWDMSRISSLWMKFKSNWINCFMYSIHQQQWHLHTTIFCLCMPNLVQLSGQCCHYFIYKPGMYIKNDWNINSGIWKKISMSVIWWLKPRILWQEGAFFLWKDPHNFIKFIYSLWLFPFILVKTVKWT